MKNRTIIFFFLIFTLIIGCDTKEQKISADYFRNKTFTFYANDSIPPFKLNFDDSTCYQIEEKPSKFNWKLNYYNNSNFLILNNIVFGIKVNPKENNIELIRTPYFSFIVNNNKKEDLSSIVDIIINNC